MMQFILFVVLGMSQCFLLQTNSPLNSGTQTAGNQQYITKGELFDTQNQLQNELNYVRNDMNKKIDFLTSQLQQMLASFQQQITGQRCHNDTKAVEGLELKYNEVMENYTKLQHKFDSLQIEYSKQLQAVNNKTKELEEEIVNLNSLRNINQLTDYRLLQQEVQSIGAQTHSLAVNEEARIQDFQAFYNSFKEREVYEDGIIQSLNSTLYQQKAVNEHTRTHDFQTFYNSLKEHEVNESGIIQSLNSTLYQKIRSSEISTNASLSNVDNKIEELEKLLNVSFLDIHQQISKNSEKVALTACAEYSEFSSGIHQNGYIIKYGDIRTRVNVNNLSLFQSSGTFTCEKEGLYLVSAWDMSPYEGSEFSIYKNGMVIANAYITGSNDHSYTATAVVAVDLQPNDNVWVQVFKATGVFYDKTSCLTIAKVQ